MKLFVCTTLILLSVLFCLTRFSSAQKAGETSGSETLSSKTADALLATLDINSRVQTVAFSPDSRLLAAGYGFHEDGGIRIWNVSDHSVVATLLDGNLKKEGIERIAFSADGKLFAAASDDGNVMLWNIGLWQTYKTVLKQRGQANDLIFSPDSTKLAFSSENTAILCDLETNKTTKIINEKTQDNSITGISFSPDGASVIICRDESIQVWDIKSGKLTRTWPAEAGGFFGRLSPDGRHIIAGGGAVFGEKSVEIWNYPEGKKIKDISGIEGGLFALAISHSGNLFAVAGGNYGSGGSLSLWTIDDTHELGFVSFGHMPIQGIAFNHDDTLLAAASESGAVLLYSVDRLRGPEVKKQDLALCGEIVVEENSTYIVPISKAPLSRGDEFAWKLPIANADAVETAVGLPVILQNWAIESSATGERARIIDFKPLLNRPAPDVLSNYIIFGVMQNPDWSNGFIAKIYGDGTFITTSSVGKFQTYGNLEQLKTNFQSVKQRLIEEGLMLVPKEPLAMEAAHFRTCFIGLMSDGVYELRSDADSLDVLLKGPSKKREAFTVIADKEEAFLNLLRQPGKQR